MPKRGSQIAGQAREEQRKHFLRRFKRHLENYLSEQPRAITRRSRAIITDPSENESRALYPLLRGSIDAASGPRYARVLRRIGCEINFPEEQTCCGQPAFNAGYWNDARPLAERFVRVFRSAEAVVCPSGSCTTMVRNFYPELLAGTALQDEARQLGKRVFEFSEFLGEGSAAHRSRRPLSPPRGVPRRVPRSSRTPPKAGATRTSAASPGTRASRNAIQRRLLRIWRHLRHKIQYDFRRHGRSKSRQRRSRTS